MNIDLAQFVHDALQKGATRSQIREVLLKAGWRPEEADGALEQFLDADFPVPVPRRKPYLSAREAFLYLLLFLTLYISSFSFGTLIFQFVNRWLPDPLSDRYLAMDSITSAVRMATASLLIAFPIFVFITWVLDRAIAKDPEKRSSRVRKWLTYVTLFIAAGVIIGDFITLIYSMLAGEMTLRFVIKSLTVAAISGAIFGYYLWDLRKEEKES